MPRLREFLEKKAGEMSQDERRKRREDWLAAVGRLVAQLRAWLREADEKSLLEIAPLDVEKLEQGLGAYKAEGLRITLGDSAVQVVPVGRNVVGFVGDGGDAGVRAEGRVDITD